MLLSYEDLSPVKKMVEIEIPVEVLDSERKRVTTEFLRQAKIPGFRPGKVPLPVVRQRFAKEIQDEVINRVLYKSFYEAIADRGVQPVGDPRLEHIDEYIAGAPLKYKAEFEIKPEIQLAEYRGLEIDDPQIEVTDHDIDSMIERLRDQASSYRTETERGIEDGDFAVIEISSSGEGVEPEDPRNGHFRFGEETPLPELHDALRGKKPGERVEFDHAYGDDAQNENFRGKTVHHSVELKEIRIQEKPEVDDQFAQSVGGWETVDQMREAIAADIRRYRDVEALRMKKNQIGDRLLALHHFEVPGKLVNDELKKSLQNYARFLASQGINLETAEIDWEKLTRDFRPEAEKRARRALILEAIAKKENLVAADAEVDREIRKAAQESGREFVDVKHRLKHDGGYEELRESLNAEKALDLVLQEAKARQG
jgi:trigger factor